jgi:hypothetical protein
MKYDAQNTHEKPEADNPHMRDPQNLFIRGVRVEVPFIHVVRDYRGHCDEFRGRLWCVS